MGIKSVGMDLRKYYRINSPATKTIIGCCYTNTEEQLRFLILVYSAQHMPSTTNYIFYDIKMIIILNAVENNAWP
jgi:hypothetical protein